MRRYAGRGLGFWPALVGLAVLLSGGTARAQTAPPVPTVQFEPSTYSVNNSAGSATITVTLSAVSSEVVTASYATNDGTATAPADYLPAVGVVTFAPGETSKSFQVTIIKDSTPKPSKDFGLSLTGATIATVGIPSIATVSILDDVAPLPTVQFDVSTYSANVTDGAAIITVGLGGTSALSVTVNYATSDGTAVAGDYLPTSGTLTFHPGAVSQTFAVPLGPNAPLSTGGKTVNLALSGPTNAVLGVVFNATLLLVAPPVLVIGTGQDLIATVPSTPPKTRRDKNGVKTPGALNPANNWPAPVDLSFKSTLAITATNNKLDFQDFYFDAPDALVLFQNSGTVSLEATVTKGTIGVVFQVVRDPGDAAAVAALGANVPTITPGAQTKATLSTNAVGSFQVIAFIDKNGDGKWDANEPGISLPLLLVQVKVTTDKSRFNLANFKATLSPPVKSDRVRVTTGNFIVAMKKAAAVELDADVTLIGGGKDGQRGLDRAYVGWANVLTKKAPVGTYKSLPGKAAKTLSWIHAINGGIKFDKKTKTFSRTTFIIGQPPPPSPAGGMPLPLLDCGKPNNIDGGSDVMLSTSPVDGGVAGATPLAIGQARNIRAVDSPAMPYSLKWPSTGNLHSVKFNFEATAYLTGWTNSNGGGQPTPNIPNSVGFRTFTVAYQVEWWMSGKWGVSPAKPPANYQLTFMSATMGTSSPWNPPAVFPPAQAATATNLEVRPPTTAATGSFILQ